MPPVQRLDRQLGQLEGLLRLIVKPGITSKENGLITNKHAQTQPVRRLRQWLRLLPKRDVGHVLARAGVCEHTLKCVLAHSMHF